MDSPLLLTVEQAGRELGIGRTKMFSLLSSGAIASVRIGHARRVPRAALHLYVDGLMADATRP